MTGITIGISSKSQGQGKGKPNPISAVLLPAIQTIREGQALTETLDPTVMQSSNYTSKEGAISTVIAEWSVDDSAWTALGTATVTYDQRIQARIIVRDDQGNERVFLTGETTVAGTAPTLDASGSLQGRDLTISIDSLAGDPAPTAELTSLTLDGMDVLGDATGIGPWTYTVADSSSPQTVAWTVTATNSAGSVTASGSEISEASRFAPVALTAPSLTPASPAPGQTVTITEGTYSGAPAPTIGGTLSLGGLDVTGEMVGPDYTIPAETADGTALVWSETASNGVASDVSQRVGVTTAIAPQPVSLPSEIVILGASLVYESFGNAYDSATQTWGSANGAVTSAVQAAAGLQTAIPVYGYGIPGARLEYRADYDIPSATDRIDIVRATFPSALIVVHMGGGNVTSYRPYATMWGSEETIWQTEMGALAAKAAADDKILVGSLTFRDYGGNGTTFRNPDNGSRPFNEADDADFTGIIPALAGTASLASYGRPVFDFYRWMLLDFENRLDTDNVHLNPRGEADMRSYVIETLATILGGGEPAEIPERVATVQTLEVSDPGNGTLEIIYDGGTDSTLDSITLTDADADAYWGGTYTTYVDGSSLEVGQLATIAAKCLVAPTPSVTNDADTSSTASEGDTVSIPDVGIWLYEGGTEPTYSVEWHDDQGVIPGAAGLSYTLASGQLGEDVYPAITATLSGKSDERQTCAALTAVSGADPWIFSGSIVTNIPASEGWAFTGSDVTLIPTGI